jgi:hypothetical protein
MSTLGRQQTCAEHRAFRLSLLRAAEPSVGGKFDVLALSSNFTRDRVEAEYLWTEPIDI